MMLLGMLVLRKFLKKKNCKKRQDELRIGRDALCAEVNKNLIEEKKNNWRYIWTKHLKNEQTLEMKNYNLQRDY